MQRDDVSDDTRLRLEHGAPELTAEALVLRHPTRFGAEIRGVARARLLEAGVSPRELG
eukprot:gene10843-10923_t